MAKIQTMAKIQIEAFLESLGLSAEQQQPVSGWWDRLFHKCFEKKKKTKLLKFFNRGTPKQFSKSKFSPPPEISVPILFLFSFDHYEILCQYSQMCRLQ